MQAGNNYATMLDRQWWDLFSRPASASQDSQNPQTRHSIVREQVPSAYPPLFKFQALDKKRTAGTTCLKSLKLEFKFNLAGHPGRMSRLSKGKSMETKLFIQNLPRNCSEGDLKQLFASHGIVKSTNIPKDHRSGRPRGFGFVEMNSHEDAVTALECLDKTNFKGKKLRVAFSEKQKKERKRSTAYSYLMF